MYFGQQPHVYVKNQIGREDRGRGISFIKKRHAAGTRSSLRESGLPYPLEQALLLLADTGLQLGDSLVEICP